MQLSSCLYEWDASDYDLLMSAKKSKLAKAGITTPSLTGVEKAVTQE